MKISRNCQLLHYLSPQGHWDHAFLSGDRSTSVLVCVQRSQHRVTFVLVLPPCDPAPTQSLTIHAPLFSPGHQSPVWCLLKGGLHIFKGKEQKRPPATFRKSSVAARLPGLLCGRNLTPLPLPFSDENQMGRRIHLSNSLERLSLSLQRYASMNCSP